MVKKILIILILLSALPIYAQDGSAAGLKISVYRGVGKKKKTIGYFTPCACYPSPTPHNFNPEETNKKYCVPCPAKPLSSTDLDNSNNQNSAYMTRSSFISQVNKNCNFPGELMLISNGEPKKYFAQFLYTTSGGNASPANDTVAYFILNKDKKTGKVNLNPRYLKKGEEIITYSKDLTLQGGQTIDLVCPNQL